MLDLFDTMKIAIAALEEQYMNKLLAQKQQNEGDVLRKRVKLHSVDRALHALEGALAAQDCDASDLVARWRDARTLLDLSTAPKKRSACAASITCSGGDDGGEIVVSRDELAREFLSAARTQLSATRLCNWLDAPQDMLGLFISVL